MPDPAHDAAPVAGWERRTRPWLDVACLSLLAVACGAHLSSLEAVLDLPTWDEADSLRIGVHWPRASLPEPEWGPLYALWYVGLARVFDDPVQLFYESYRLLVVLPCFAIYACVRRFGGAPVVALLGSVAFLLSAAAHVDPRSSILALLVVTVAVALLARVRRTARFAGGLSLALLLASFARPELFVSFLVVAGVALVAVAVHAGRDVRGRWLRAVPRIAVWMGLVLVLLAVWGNPMSDRSNRRRYAFCQHYAFGEVQRAGLDLNPWTQCEEVLAGTFGSADTVAGAALRNPGAFAEHVLHNLARYPVRSWALFLRGFDDGWTPTRQLHAWVLFLLVASAGLRLVNARQPRARAPSRRWRLRRPVRNALLVALAVTLPTAASSILIWPRQHYLVLQGVAFCLLGVAAVSGPRRDPARLTPVNIGGPVAVIALMASWVPGIALRPASGFVQENRRVVEALAAAALPEGGRVGILEAQGGYDAYLGPSFRRVRPETQKPGETFRAFLERTRTRVVVIDELMLRHQRRAKDPGLDAFIRAPGSFGFQVVDVPGTSRRIATLEPSPQMSPRIGESPAPLRSAR